MTLFAAVLTPLVVGASLGLSGRLASRMRVRQRRAIAGGLAVLTMIVTIVLVVLAMRHAPAAAQAWGSGLAVTLGIDAVVASAAIVVPSVALPVVVWAAAHEEPDGLERLVGGLVAFVGAMELLVLAADLLALTIGWELVGALSWMLVAHHIGDATSASSAGYTYNATRLGGMGLLVAAGAAWASAGSLSLDALPGVARGPWGDALAGGILFAAVAKSAQLPFSPWIFRAMQGPSSVSALLHSSTMVAAGAWLLVRLHEPLGIVAWFAPAAIAIGLATAWVAGVVAFMQHDAKRVLAASTSAQFGLAFAAVGAGSAGAALVHLGNHAVFKALLFLAAGIAITAAGTERLSSMRLGRALPATAAASLLGVLALAGVPPLGAAWSKEGVVAAAGESSRALAVLLLGAGALSAAYAARFQVLAFGRANAPRRASSRPEIIAVLAVATLAVVVAASSVLSWPSVEHAVESFTELAVPEPRLWETVVSLATIGLAAGIGVAFARVELRRRAATEGSAHDWLGLAAATEHVVVAPIRAASRVCAALEARLRSASVRGVVALSRWLPRAMRNILSWQQAIPGGVVALSRWLPRTMRKFLSWRQAVAAARRVSKASVTRAEPAIDASGRGVAWAIDTAGEGIRRGHPGAVPLHYAFVIGGFAVLAIGTWIWSWR